MAGPTGPTGAANLAQTQRDHGTIVNGIGVTPTSILTAPFTVTATAGQKFIVMASGVIVAGSGTPTATYQLLAPGALVSGTFGVDTTGVPWAINFESGALTAGAHTIDIQFNSSSGVNTINSQSESVVVMLVDV